MLSTDPLTPGGISTLASLSYGPQETQVTVQVQEELSCSWHCAISDGTHWLPAIWGDWATHFTVDGRETFILPSAPPMIMKITKAAFRRSLGIVFIYASIFVERYEGVIGHAKRLPIEIVQILRHFPDANLRQHWKFEPSLWPVRALATYKSELDEQISHGSGSPFFMLHLLDETGEIRAHANSGIARELHDRFEEGKMYWISNAKSFTMCHETTDTPTLKFEFVPLSRLLTAPEDSIWDIAIVTRTGPLEITKNSKTGHQLFKRVITIVDRDETVMSATLWAIRAKEFGASTGTIVAFRHVKMAFEVGKAGPVLSILSTSTVHIEPQMEEATALRQWYVTTTTSSKKRKRQEDDA